MVKKPSQLNSTPGVIVIEGHIQGLANARLLAEEDIPVIVIDKGNCIARYSKYCIAYFKCPDYLDDALADFLIRMHGELGLQDWLLLPSNDHAVLTIARNKPNLSKCFRIITEDIDTVESIYDKRKLLSLALQSGIPIPVTYMPETENPQSVNMRYPILIKGSNGLTFYKRYRQKAILINSESSLKDAWVNYFANVIPTDYFLQEVIPNHNKTISVAVFSIKGEIQSYWMGVKLREHPLTFGTATCCQSVFIEDLLYPSRTIIKALDYTGVCEIEFLRDSRDNEYKLIEINARTWLWVGLAAKSGVNFPLMIYKYVHEGQIPEQDKYSIGNHWMNLFTDVAYGIKGFLKGVYKPKPFLASYADFIEASFSIRDPLPFFVYILLLSGFVRDR